MINKLKYIFLTLFIFLNRIAVCQSDSIPVINYDSMNTDIKTVVLPSVFNLLGNFGVNITPFAGLISVTIMFIIRYFEKKKLKEDTARQIRNVVVAGYQSGTPSMPLVHENALKKIIDKLEGIKK